MLLHLHHELCIVIFVIVWVMGLFQCWNSGWISILLRRASEKQKRHEKPFIKIISLNVRQRHVLSLICVICGHCSESCRYNQAANIGYYLLFRSRLPFIAIKLANYCAIIVYMPNGWKFLLLLTDSGSGSPNQYNYNMYIQLRHPAMWGIQQCIVIVPCPGHDNELLVFNGSWEYGLWIAWSLAITVLHELIVSEPWSDF